MAFNATSGEIMAVKQVELPQTPPTRENTQQLEALKFEIHTLKDLDHPNVVQYLGFEHSASFLSMYVTDSY